MQEIGLHGHLIVVLVAVTTTLICVALHYETLDGMRRLVAGMKHRRPRMLMFVVVILMLHTAEIWLFAGAYYLLTQFFDVATFVGLAVEGIADYAYYSAMVYTTVGFGDITPSGPVRSLTQVEAVTGLVMITWSSTYTFLEMQSTWHRRS